MKHNSSLKHKATNIFERQPIIDLVSLISGGTYILKSTPNDRVLEKLLMVILFCYQNFCQKSAERKSSKTTFVLMSDLRL